jgi:hypothetical protein
MFFVSAIIIKLILVSDKLSLAAFGVTNDEEVWTESHPCGQGSVVKETTSDIDVEKAMESNSVSIFETKNSSCSNGVKESILKLAAHQSKAYETYMQGTLIFLKALENVQNRPKQFSNEP